MVKTNSRRTALISLAVMAAVSMGSIAYAQEVVPDETDGAATEVSEATSATPTITQLRVPDAIDPGQTITASINALPGGVQVRCQFTFNDNIGTSTWAVAMIGQMTGFAEIVSPAAPAGTVSVTTLCQLWGGSGFVADATAVTVVNAEPAPMPTAPTANNARITNMVVPSWVAIGDSVNVDLNGIPGGSPVRCNTVSYNEQNEVTNITPNGWTESALGVVTGATSLSTGVVPRDSVRMVTTCEIWNNVAWVGATVRDVRTTPLPQWCLDYNNSLTRGGRLNQGDWLISNNCQFGLITQVTDGNVVIYELDPHAARITTVRALAATNKSGSPSTLVFQSSDGNLVQYIGELGAEADAVANTRAHPGGNWLTLQDDSNLVVYANADPANPGAALWARFGLGAGSNENGFFKLNTK